ncbi:MAG TPA: ArsA-related P-loop ATPase [Candidatus Binataceae bacterium]|nr:ArsA-related P-loop ATPase [Candidatus Binataceae bacterium]
MAWPRLTFVIGKGGAGKSTVATALATYLASSRPTVLADLDQRGSAARLLGVRTPAEGPARAGEGVELRSLSPRRELEHFIRRIVPVRIISNRMLGSRTFAYVTAALPGLQAFLLLSRLSSMAGEAAREDRYVVVDGLSTGASLELLSVATGVRNLAGGGTLNHLAAELESFISDPNRFGVAIVVPPQELALKEALEAASTLRAQLKVDRAIAVLNGAPAPLFSAAEAERAMEAEIEHAGLVRRRLDLDSAAQRIRKELTAAGLAVIELPMLFTAAIGSAEVEQLSRSLRKKVEA